MAYAHQGFLLDEDEALKALLSGMTVADEQSSARPVRVRFGYGDPELTGDTPGSQISYPFLTIALMAVREETDRAHRGIIALSHLPDGTAVDPNGPAALVEFPIPVEIDYQIVSHARSARHDRQIVSQVASSKLPFRFGVLSVDDGTVRRLDLLAGPETSDFLREGKREYRKIWSVRVSSELPADTVNMIRRAATVGLTVLLTGPVDRALATGDTASAVESQVAP